MRKFLISLVILILAGGAVFYLGWVQLQLPPNTYGVVFTKTGGWDDAVLEPGEFHWRWERLLPTNFTLHAFPSTPHNAVVTSSGTLPSGDTYAEYLEQSPDFDYEIELDVSFRVRKEDLPELAKEEDLEPDGLEEWYEQRAKRIGDAARTMVREVYADAQEEADGAVQLQSLEDELIDRLSERFSSLEFLSAVPTIVRIPDFGLYQAARSLYFETINARREAVADSEFAAEESRIAQKTRLETLKQYGEILTEYPVLLDYFSLSVEQGVDPLALEAVRSLQGEGAATQEPEEQ